MAVDSGSQQPLLLTVPEAAALLRLGKNKVYDLVDRGEIPAIRLGRSIRIPRHRLLAWIDRNSSDGEATGGLTSVVDFAASQQH